MESQIVSPPFLKEITIKAAEERERCHERFISSFKKVTEPFPRCRISSLWGESREAAADVQIAAKKQKKLEGAGEKQIFFVCTLGPKNSFSPHQPSQLLRPLDTSRKTEN
jgi:hypothetical protein